MSISIEFQKRFIEMVSDIEGSKTSISNYLGINYALFDRMFNYGILPSMPILMRIADKLNISVEYLLGKTDDEHFSKSQAPVHFLVRFEQLRNEKNLTYYEVYKGTLIETSYFANWKREKSIPKLEQLLDLCKFFNVSLDYLLGRTDDK